MKRLIALFIGITIGTTSITACSNNSNNTTNSESTSATAVSSTTEVTGRSIVETAFENGKNLNSYDIEIELINVLDSPEYIEQSLVRTVEASYIKSPLTIEYFSNDIYGPSTEILDVHIFIKENGKELNSYYNDSLYGWIIEDVDATDIPGFLFDQADTIESFLKLGTEFTIIDTETIDGKEVYTVEMHGNIDLMKTLMATDDSSFDPYMKEAGDFYMTVKCTDEAIIEYNMDFRELYAKLADAIEGTGVATEEELMFAEIYRISHNSYNIKISNLNGVSSIEDPEGIEDSITYDEAWEIYQIRMTDGIQPEDIMFNITDPDGAAALENSTISIYYPDTGETVVLQEGNQRDEFGNLVDADGNIIEESGVQVNLVEE